MSAKTLDAPLIAELVRLALAEDIGAGDITATLIPVEQEASGRVITREACVLAGRELATEVFRQVDPRIRLDWRAEDGHALAAGAELLRFAGPARGLLTAERTALNFLQTLSGTATATAAYVARLAGTGCRLLDTRKTVPGLRLAQKYAVACGGGHNHRLGLYDAFLIKENHIAAAGGIAAAVTQARAIAPGKPVEVEVENFAELDQALGAGADIVMLDNFSHADMAQAVSHTAGRAKLEASGNVELDTIRAVAETGVDFISVGALTKHVRAIDLSMRFD
ncbi:MAG: carboxylating nicotinate-nucleotide diphosphorylase [Gammaproteobacteria bacterium]|nr:carboxylating nicotinate-nucleotide diphosphorylase [Gammaproteobacteria bacterium]